MTNETVLERTSNLIMPSHYVELDEEEMSYVDGGYDRFVTYVGNDAWEQVAKYAGVTIVSVLSMVGSVAALCATSVTIIGAVIAVAQFMSAFASAIFNFINFVTAMVYTVKFGSFTAREYGWFMFNFTTVIGQ